MQIAVETAFLLAAISAVGVLRWVLSKQLMQALACMDDACYQAEAAQNPCDITGEAE
jgi:hypothetical protein